MMNIDYHAWAERMRIDVDLVVSATAFGEIVALMPCIDALDEVFDTMSIDLVGVPDNLVVELAKEVIRVSGF